MLKQEKWFNNVSVFFQTCFGTDSHPFYKPGALSHPPLLLALRQVLRGPATEQSMQEAWREARTTEGSSELFFGAAVDAPPLGSLVVPFYPFGGGFPHYRKKGTLILTSLLEDLADHG